MLLSAKDFRLTIIANLYNTITPKSNIKFAQLLFNFRREISFDVLLSISRLIFQLISTKNMCNFLLLLG